MKVGINHLPFRSSPARAFLLRQAVQQQRVQVHSAGPIYSPNLDAMLQRANSQYEDNGPPPQRSQPRSQSFLPSSSPSTHNADIRQQLKKSNAPAVSARTMPQFSRPLQNRPSNMNQ